MISGDVIEYRKMSPDDLKQVSEIEKRIFSEPWSQAGFAASLNSKDTVYVSAVKNGRVVGYCGLLQSLEEADITNVAVEETSRGQGIGQAMLTSLMEFGKERGISRFTLEVRKSNQAAIHLYEKLGFESAGIRKRFYQKPEEDAVIMWTR
ncbi:MAG: ribosomal protein S18-alanine N-acetyltransferase [Lachnospiraceae bacterium]|nr:ribosomal protein S18-alanine N-acetyltransferase [Lachnospiraceae bacterium]